MSREARIETFQSPRSLLWYWRMRAGNGRVIADGAEGYAKRTSAVRAAYRFVELASTATFRVVLP